MSERPRPIPTLAVFVLAFVFSQLFLCLYLLQSRIDEHFGEYRSTEEILYIENGELLKKVLLGFDNVAADLYWLRTVQYFGGKRLDDPDKRFDLLEPLLEITTDLDPYLKIAYSYGAIFLSEPRPRGAGLPVKGLVLIDKGIRNNPEYWRFYLEKGFIHYWHLEDYKKAADIFIEGSKLPGAAYWMVSIAGETLTKGGDRQTARQLWQTIANVEENPQIRGNAVLHLQQLDAMDGIDSLTELALKFKEDRGHFPRSWDELIQAKLLPGAPLDPTGIPFVINPWEESVEVSIQSTLAGLSTR